ncbi:MAG: hypothetical protein RIC35_15285 [Marinoscillum sp.]
MKKSNNSSGRTQEENLIRKALYQNGLLFPSNEAELEIELQTIENMNIPIPSALNDEGSIFKESKKSYQKETSPQSNSDYSLAARQGGKISDETISKILSRKSKNGQDKDTDK